MTDPFTTGVPSLDSLIQGVRVGDNLVVQSHGGGPVLDTIVEHFVSARGGRSLVACTAGVAWPGGHPDDLLITDLAAGNSAPPSSVEQARETVADLDRQVGGEALFVFWTLTAMQEAWGADASLDFFLWACPRLYTRGSIALWPMDPKKHKPKYLRRLAEITQVIVDIKPGEAPDTLRASVLKADGRPDNVVGRRVDVDATSLAPVGQPGRGDTALGERVLAERTQRGISQTELARLVDISPSALSQLERGTRGVSADTITRIWQSLGVPFGPEDPRPSGYVIARRGAQPSSATSHGMTRRRLTAEPGLAETWLITIDPDASGRGAPFPVKSPELITVLSGVVDLDVGGQLETLQAGDSLVTTSASVAGWSNPGATPADLHWSILPA